MAQYTHTSFAAAATIVSTVGAGINQELRTIAAAHNLHAAADIATTGSVSNAALITNKNYFSMVLRENSTITGAPSSATIQAYCVVPCNCEVVSGFVTVVTKAAAGDQQVHIYKEGSPDVRVFAAQAITSGYDCYNLVGPLLPTLSAGDVLSMRVSFATTANTSAYNLCTILAKAVHD